MEKIYNRGAYPTMITPYNTDGTVDYGGVAALTEWYWHMGCGGIFASCQSSEIWFLGEDDRVKLTRTVKNTADALARTDKSRKPMTIVSSGHVSDASDDQVRELNRIAETGADAVILITNRMDIANTSDGNWIRDCEKLIAKLPEETKLGLYECPSPYKRLLTPEMLRWAVSTERFRFIKDTCCDADEIGRRMKILAGTELLLFNANAQTLLPCLKSGSAGYCGIMANFHPKLYVWLCENWANDPETAEEAADFLSLAAFTESLAYPITAKYHHAKIAGNPMQLYAKSRNTSDFRPYDAMCVEQMHRAACRMEEKLGL
ncbi:MAG: dihydrodipicolinate synthase family protein [Clostridia bacterium]|nr:dihydrodipicolinate synthase family protein [Clostridia bacterium]